MDGYNSTRSLGQRLNEDGDCAASVYLLVLDGDTSSIFQLPHAGLTVIGRAPDADLRVQHSSVSRQHAAFTRDDEGVLRVADLGSHNGTRLNGEVISEPRTLGSGDIVSAGDVVMIVRFSTPITVARAAYGDAEWRRRLLEELERAIEFKRSLAVVAVLDASPTAVELMSKHLRLIDAVGTGESGQAFVLLPEVDRATACDLIGDALCAANELAPARAGLAMCPTDACDVDMILLVARAAARRAKP